GWTVASPSSGASGTVTITNTGVLAPGQSATFVVQALARNAAAGTTFESTARVGPDGGDPSPQNNSVTLTATSEQEGLAFKNVKVFHFTDANPNANASIFTAYVGWGDGKANISNTGTGTVSVVANPNGGFDVLGSHTYDEEGRYSALVVVAGSDGT